MSSLQSEIDNLVVRIAGWRSIHRADKARPLEMQLYILRQRQIRHENMLKQIDADMETVNA